MSNRTEKDIAPDDLEREKLVSEIALLQAKTVEIGRPEYKRLTFWIAIATAVLATVGTIGQFLWSRNEYVLVDIEREQAELELSKADRKAQLAEESLKKLEIELRNFQSTIASLLESFPGDQNLSNAAFSVVYSRLVLVLSTRFRKSSDLIRPETHLVGDPPALTNSFYTFHLFMGDDFHDVFGVEKSSLRLEKDATVRDLALLIQEALEVDL